MNLASTVFRGHLLPLSKRDWHHRFRSALVFSDGLSGFVIAHVLTMASEEDGRIGNQDTSDSRVQHRRKSVAKGLICQTTCLLLSRCPMWKVWCAPWPSIWPAFSRRPVEYSESRCPQPEREVAEIDRDDLREFTSTVGSHTWNCIALG